MPAARFRKPKMIRWLALILILMTSPAWAGAAKPDLVLTGRVLGADHQTYKPVTFDVPPGVTRLTVEVDYARDQKTVVDLGLMDPVRFRGWSGGNKKRFTVSAEDATPSYLPGPLPAGRWTLLLGVPNARPGSSAAYEARITFERHPGVTSFAPAPLKAAPGWYRGDLHMHTAHSDGSCLTQSGAQSGARAPCPVYRTVLAAQARGLDFIAITDHNTTSHYEAMAELQPAFDQLLLIPGREVTTFQGHANVFGPTAFIDFRLGDPAVPTIKALQDAVAAAGGVFSINHPSSPSGEMCMGCGWTVPNTDYSEVQSIEVANGGSQRAQGGGVEGPLFGVPFWEAQLNAGHRITAVGGSDNHDAGLPPETPGRRPPDHRGPCRGTVDGWNPRRRPRGPGVHRPGRDEGADAGPVGEVQGRPGGDGRRAVREAGRGGGLHRFADRRRDGRRRGGPRRRETARDGGTRPGPSR